MDNSIREQESNTRDQKSFLAGLLISIALSIGGKFHKGDEVEQQEQELSGRLGDE